MKLCPFCLGEEHEAVIVCGFPIVGCPAVPRGLVIPYPPRDPSQVADRGGDAQRDGAATSPSRGAKSVSSGAVVGDPRSTT